MAAVDAVTSAVACAVAACATARGNTAAGDQALLQPLRFVPDGEWVEDPSAVAQRMPLPAELRWSQNAANARSSSSAMAWGSRPER